MPRYGEEALRLREEALTDYAAALLARATAAETRCRTLEAELADAASREQALRREVERAALLETELAETKECLGRATELLLRSPGVSPSATAPGVPAGEPSSAPPSNCSPSPRAESGEAPPVARG